MIDWAQLSVGTATPILEDHRELLHLEGAWIPHLRGKLKKINATIKLINTWNTKTQREGDEHIMDQLIDSPDISAEQVIKADYVRKILQVSTIADITTSDGTTIKPGIFNGQDRKIDPMRTNIIHDITWPRQTKPPNAT
eukprot:12480436-Ditylum_brightwellii.AAC.1